MINKIKESSQFIKNEFPSEIHSAIILGSGTVSYTHLTLPTKA